MCGRYVSPDEASIEREFNLVHAEWQFPPSFNVAPTQLVPVVRDVEGTSRGSLMRWGLIPFFARGVPTKYSTINARIETLQTAASYRGPWKRAQRCLVIARGFFEWQVQADGKTKVPYYIHTNDQETFAFAGLWDSSQTEAGDRIESVAHITMPANSLLGEIHNTKQRMPAILEKADREAWLRGSPEEAWETLTPYPDDLMVAWPVTSRVNTPRNNDAQLIEPLPL
jgi:putative SOS response-associated peptidase YedK